MKRTGEGNRGREWQGLEACAGGHASHTRATHGFTLVEIMIVISIMIILLALVIPGYKVMSAQNQRNICAANLKAIGQALALFREDYQCYPPDATEYLPLPPNPNDIEQNPADSIHAAYNEDTNQPIETGIRGRGIYALYYLGAYSMTLPPTDLEPAARLGADLRNHIAAQREGLNAFKWYRSGGYITDPKVFHCPANPAGLDDDDLTRNIYPSADPAQRVSGIPTLGGWNNYDVYYRRNFWNPGTRILPITNGVLENRHLLQPYPPSDTPVTWCAHHRKAGAPNGPGVEGKVSAGDKDLVLFADGSVHRMASRADGQLYREPPNNPGWPAGPIM
jgi:prepilin-type N-terminal cleavage/methylation domain-containing protein